jgi:hypothetical protein
MDGAKRMINEVETTQVRKIAEFMINIDGIKGDH